MNTEHIKCRGKCLNSYIAGKIICRLFAGEELPTYIGIIADETYQYHQQHGGTLPEQKAKREIVIMHALNELRRADLAEKFKGNYWRIHKRRRMIDTETQHKMHNECMNPLYECLAALHEAKSAIEKNIPLIDDEIDVFGVRAQLIGLLDGKEVEKINAYRPSLKIDVSEIIGYVEQLKDEIGILFSIWNKYSIFMPTSEN